MKRLVESLRPPPMHTSFSGMDWSRVEAEFGGVPADFKNFMHVFGPGSIDDFFWILSPKSSNPSLDMVVQLVEMNKILASLRIMGEDIPFPEYPEEGCLLPFGATTNGDSVWWKSCGNPDVWSVIVSSDRESDWHQYSMGAVEFIDCLVSRELEIPIFPRGFPSARPIFRRVLE